MVFETIVLSFICLAALIGNVSLFLIVYKDRHLQTITNLFILNLTAADILVSLLSMPVIVVTIISERWVFGHTACVALGFFTLLSFIASVMSQPIFLHCQVEHLHKDLLREKSTALGRRCVVCVNIFGLPSTLRLGGISLHSWKIILFCLLAF